MKVNPCCEKWVKQVLAIESERDALQAKVKRYETVLHILANADSNVWTFQVNEIANAARPTVEVEKEVLPHGIGGILGILAALYIMLAGWSWVTFQKLQTPIREPYPIHVYHWDNDLNDLANEYRDKLSICQAHDKAATKS